MLEPELRVLHIAVPETKASPAKGVRAVPLRTNFASTTTRSTTFALTLIAAAVLAVTITGCGKRSAEAVVEVAGPVHGHEEPRAEVRRNRVVVTLTDADLAALHRWAEERGLPLGTVVYEVVERALRRQEHSRSR